MYKGQDIYDWTVGEVFIAFRLYPTSHSWSTLLVKEEERKPDAMGSSSSSFIKQSSSSAMLMRKKIQSDTPFIGTHQKKPNLELHLGIIIGGKSPHEMS